MLPRKKTPAEHIEVTDQVGKRHVVVKYTEHIEGNTDDNGSRGRSEIATSYRLATGRSVSKTGASTFQTVDGLLRLKVR